MNVHANYSNKPSPVAGQATTGHPATTGQPQGIAPTMDDESASGGSSFHCRGNPLWLPCDGGLPCGGGGNVQTTTPSMPLVEIKRLKKSYAFHPILRGIDLVLQPRECLALLGANGAGKTTLLRILACLTKPDKGSITLNGLDMVDDAQQVRRLIGFVAHQPYLYEELTAWENLLYFARMYAVEHPQEQARTLLERVGLSKRTHERVGTLSRGQLQRLAWARALLHAPQLLLLDEADTGLDQTGHTLIDTLLAEHLERGGSAIFTTHQLERALQLGARVVILASGRVAYQQETSTMTLASLQKIYGEVAK